MNGLISFDGSNVRLTLPDVSVWGLGDWAIFFGIIGAVYGIVTHLASLSGVRKYNRAVDADHYQRCPVHSAAQSHPSGAVVDAYLDGRVRCQCDKDQKTITNGMLIVVLFWRVTLQLWYRIIMLVLGIIGLPILSIATFRIRLWNEVLSEACEWFMKPADLWSRLRRDHRPGANLSLSKTAEPTTD